MKISDKDRIKITKLQNEIILLFDNSNLENKVCIHSILEILMQYLAENCEDKGDLDAFIYYLKTEITSIMNGPKLRHKEDNEGSIA